MGWRERLNPTPPQGLVEKKVAEVNTGKGIRIAKAFDGLTKPLPASFVEDNVERAKHKRQQQADKHALKMTEEAKRIEEGRPTLTQRAAVTTAGAIGYLLNKTGGAVFSTGEYLTRGIRGKAKKGLDRALGYDNDPKVTVVNPLHDEDIIEAEYTEK